MKFSLFSISYLLLLVNLSAQGDLGFPKVTNFSKDEYRAAIRNWDIEIDNRGKTYFANDYGILAFDGQDWKIILQPINKTTVTSLCIDSKNKMYLGATNELGFLIHNGIGQIAYTSLVSLISEENRNFGAVKSIENVGNKIFFITTNVIFVYQDGKIEELPVSEGLELATVSGGIFFRKPKGQGLYSWKEGESTHLPETEFLSDKTVISIVTNPYGHFIVTEKHGFFQYEDGHLKKWEVSFNEELGNLAIHSFLKMSNGNYAIGTKKEGLFVLDNRGNLLMHIDRHSGLRFNGITAMTEDKRGNLWLALDNGISYVEIGSDVRFIDERKGLEGSVYAMEIFEDQLIAGTSQGLFRSFKTKNGNFGNFDFVPNSEGQIWDLEEFEGQLMVGNHEGAFNLKGRTLEAADTLSEGAWMFAHPYGNSNFLIQGSYQGLFRLEKVNGMWGNTVKIKNFDVVCREFMFDREGFLWVGHGYNGVYRLRLNSDFTAVEETKLFNSRTGLPSNFFTNVFNIEDQVYFGTQHGVYSYDSEREIIKPDSLFQEILGNDQLVRRLMKMPNGDLFYIKGFDNEDEVGVISFSEDSYLVKKAPFQNLVGEFIPAFEDIVFFNDDILFGSKNGIIVYTPSNKHLQTNYFANVSRVSLTNAQDSIIFGDMDDFDPQFPQGFVQEIPFEQNALRIRYSATGYKLSSDVQFQTLLEGYEQDWTIWNTDRYRAFTNLPEGKYTFKVRAKDINGQISEEDKFIFVIQAPWYRSPFMYLVYALPFGLIIFGLIKLKDKQIKQLSGEQERILEEQRQEHAKKNLENERKLHQLETEKLLEKIESKNQELASSTMNLMKLNQVILDIKEKIEQIDFKNINSDKKKLAKLVSNVDDLIENDQNWENFEMLFNQVHDNFIQRLKTSFPDLTARDIRLCAYLRMNLHSKEIAPLIGVSYRAVEAMRYRVRKKMALESQENLAEFIISF